VFIVSEASHSNFVTQKELFRFIEQHFNKTLTYGWINGFLEWRASQLKRMTIVPQQLMRVQMLRFSLHHYIALVQTHVLFILAELIFSMDETSLSD
jgi:hypothetical protein